MSNIPEIQRLEQAIGELEAYEQPVSLDQCKNAIQTVLALAAILEQALEGNGQRRKSGFTIPVTVEMVKLHYAIDQAKQARSHLAAFQPLSQSSGERARRKRQIAVYHMRNFVRAATEALGQQEDALQPRLRPDYLRLVEPQEWLPG